MKDRRNYKLFMIIFCLLISIIALFLSFQTHKKAQLDKTAEPTESEKTAVTDSQKPTEYDLEVEESNGIQKSEYMEPLPELYLEDGVQITIYFTNTEALDNGTSLPLEAQSKLVEKTQLYLIEQGIETAEELRIVSEITKDDITVHFQCEIVGSDRLLTIYYDLSQRNYSFAIEEEKA